MKKVFLLTIGIFSFVVVCFGLMSIRQASNSNLDGNWSGLVVTTNGGCALDYKFVEVGNHLLGTAVSPQGEASIVEGTINGSKIDFIVSFQGTAVKHTGKYSAADNSIAMDLDLGGTKLHTTLKKSI